MSTLTPQEIDALLQALPTLPKREQEQLLADLEQLEAKNALTAAREDFLAFCYRVYPGFKEGPHHRHLRPLLHGVRDGTEPRLTISLAPRFGKSELISYLFVAWYLGHFPNHHIMMVTHTADLSTDYGRKVRNLIDSPVYQEVFPDTCIAKDKSSASNWATTQGGKYLAVGIGANVAGHGAHCLHPRTHVAGAGRVGAIKIGDTLTTKKGDRVVLKKLLTTHGSSFIINDDLQASGNHPFYTQHGWTFAQDLQVGDRIETLTIWRNIWQKIFRRK